MRLDPRKLGASARSLCRSRNLAGNKAFLHQSLKTPYLFILPDQDGFRPLAGHKSIIPNSDPQSIASNWQAELPPSRHLAAYQIAPLALSFAYPILRKAD